LTDCASDGANWPPGAHARADGSATIDGVMKNLRSGAAALLLSVLTVACSDSPAMPTSPTAARGSLALTASQISGAWTLTSIQVAGQGAQPVPAGASYTLNFADSRFSVRADCNTCVGTYGISGSTVTLGPALACTRAACPTMQFEATYTNLLSVDATARLTADTLILTSPSGALSFTR
jgi:heat shock protein HslJ